MEDIRRQDRKIFLRELLRPNRVLGWILITVLCFLSFAAIGVPIGFGVAPLAIWCLQAYSASLKRQFIHDRYRTLWAACDDRLERFHNAVKLMRKHDIAEFSEMPRTIQNVGQSVYVALRRADLVFTEVSQSEGRLSLQNPPPGPPHPDAQARELYRIADKNIAEYKHQLSGVMAGIHRAEAQAAVFTTTLDTLQVKMLSCRLTGRKPELSSQEFLESLTEARLQLEAIDKALDELELSPFPKTIAVLPPEQDSHESRGEPGS